MEHVSHPLLPVIADWAENAPQRLIRFAAPENFQVEIDLAALLDYRLGHPHAKAEMWKGYERAAFLGKALAGTDFDIRLHEMIYRAASGSPQAFALCEAAYFAQKIGGVVPAAFYGATHLDGFQTALEAWTRHCGYDLAFSGPDQLPFIVRDVVEEKNPAGSFWLTAYLGDFANDGKSFVSEISSENAKHEDAKRKRVERGTKRPPPVFRDRIAFGWLPCSLWARTAAGIVSVLQPDTVDAVKAEERIRKDISGLKYADSHRGDHEWVFQIGEIGDV